MVDPNDVIVIVAAAAAAAAALILISQQLVYLQHALRTLHAFPSP